MYNNQKDLEYADAVYRKLKSSDAVYCQHVLNIVERMVPCLLEVDGACLFRSRAVECIPFLNDLHKKRLYRFQHLKNIKSAAYVAEHWLWVYGTVQYGYSAELAAHSWFHREFYLGIDRDLIPDTEAYQSYWLSIAPVFMDFSQTTELLRSKWALPDMKKKEIYEHIQRTYTPF